MPDGVRPDEAFDLALRHAGEVIPGAVVFTDMLEAEPVIILKLLARARRPVDSLGPTALMVASPQGRSDGRLRRGNPGFPLSYHLENMESSAGPGKHGRGLTAWLSAR